jgi:hypothetical protein
VKALILALLLVACGGGDPEREQLDDRPRVPAAP